MTDIIGVAVEVSQYCRGPAVDTVNDNTSGVTDCDLQVCTPGQQDTTDTATVVITNSKQNKLLPYVMSMMLMLISAYRSIEVHQSFCSYLQFAVRT